MSRGEIHRGFEKEKPTFSLSVQREAELVTAGALVEEVIPGC